jgi:hypothetical protein
LQKASLKDSMGMQQYQVFLNTGEKFYFNGNSAPPYYISKYGYNQDTIPTITKYVHDNYPGQTITNVTYSKTYNSVEYIVYLSSNAKVYFNGSYSWLKTYYYKLNTNQLPVNILSYFDQYPNAIFNEIDYTVWPKGASSIYDIYLVGNKHFKFDANGVFQEFEFDNVSEEDLPPAVKVTIDRYYPYPQLTILNIVHKRIDRNGTVNDYFMIYFTDGSSTYIGADGSLG